MSRSHLLRRLVVCWLCAGFTAASAAADEPLPISVQVALDAARLPPEALVAWVAEVGPPAQARSAPRLSWQARQPVNPASLMKLYSTGAALELLGPAWYWTTPVLAAGPIDARGVLQGDLVIRGRGDPSLVIERVWLLLRQLQERGVREVRGDIVLDSSAFNHKAADPADFDGDALRPYNVQPDALMLNLKTITLGFVPDPSRRVARITTDVALAGMRVDATVPLNPNDCGNWRGALKADFTDPARLKFSGSFPVACGEKSWSLAYADPASYNARLIEALWREMGGQLGGRVREGVAPAQASLLFEFASPPLASVVRDINKFSNNVMAQQLFLSLGLEAAAPPLPQLVARQSPAAQGPAAAPLPFALPRVQAAVPGVALPPSPPIDTALTARTVLREHVRERIGCTEPEVVIDNGSGLSRSSRSSAHCLGSWLQALWASPLMPELTSSLPLPGVDGTARRAGRVWGAALGRAHLKTGSLRDSAGLAGYVVGVSGRRYAFVAILNHPDANAGRPVLDALLDWTAQDGAP